MPRLHNNSRSLGRRPHIGLIIDVSCETKVTYSNKRFCSTQQVLYAIRDLNDYLLLRDDATNDDSIISGKASYMKLGLLAGPIVTIIAQARKKDSYVHLKAPVLSILPSVKILFL